MVNFVLNGGAWLCYLAGGALLASAAFVLGMSVIAALFLGGPGGGTTSFDDPATLGLAAAFGVALFAVGRLFERLAK